MTGLPMTGLPLLLTWVVQASVIGVCALVLVRVGRRWSPRFRHGFVLVSLLAFGVPPILSVPGVPTFLGSASRWIPTVSPEEPLAVIAVPGTILSVMAAVWFVGFSLIVGLIGLQAFYLQKLRRSATRVDDGELAVLVARVSTTLGLRRPPRVVLSSRTRTPFVSGVLRPTLFLPRSVETEVSSSALTQLVTHELAHIRQSDPALNWLRALVCALWWPHPLVWMLARLSRGIREECCDDLVLTELRIPAHEYARTILVAARAGVRPVAPMLASGVHDGRPGGLRSRLLRLGDSAARRAPRLNRWQGLVLLGFAALALNGAVVQVPAGPPEVGTAGDRTQTIYVHLSGDDERPLAQRHAARHGHRHNH